MKKKKKEIYSSGKGVCVVLVDDWPTTEEPRPVFLGSPDECVKYIEEHNGPEDTAHIDIRYLQIVNDDDGVVPGATKITMGRKASYVLFS